eukprot:UN24309
MKKDPNAPKRTRSAYMLFCDAQREEVKKDNPDKSMVELSVIFGKLWQETSTKDREPFQRASEKTKVKYNNEMEKYKQTKEYNTFQKRKKNHLLISKYVKQLPGAKRRVQYKVFPSDPNQPKRPSMPFFIYCNDKREDVRTDNPDKVPAEIGKMLGDMWGKLDETEKAIYKSKYDKTKKEYEIQLKKYQRTPKYKKYMKLKEQYLLDKVEYRSKMAKLARKQAAKLKESEKSDDDDDENESGDD